MYIIAFYIVLYKAANSTNLPGILTMLPLMSTIFRGQHPQLYRKCVAYFGKQMVKLTVKYAGFCNIPHSCRLHNVSNDEFLDCLVLRHTTGTVGATDGLDVPTSLLSTAVVPPLLGLWKIKQILSLLFQMINRFISDLGLYGYTS